MSRKKWICFSFVLYLLVCLPAGCSRLGVQPAPQSKPENGQQELTYVEKVKRPPSVYFDLVSALDELFKPLNKMDFTQAQAEYQKALALWETAKTETGTVKGVQETDEALKSLGTAIAAGKSQESMAGLNKFANNLQELLTNYKLSPLSDIVNLAAISRNVSWELADHDFKKAFVRTEELEKTWEQSKTNLEQAGILSEVTKAHESVDKIKGAVTAENKMAADSQLKKFNESLMKIRNFYRQKNQSMMP
ncbi:MAG TPA: hypothetical protein DEA44_03490 [Firmicutes bacterium]|nr:hypothetical protein [Bacillota bacterium]